MKKYEKKIECIVYRYMDNNIEVLSLKRTPEDGGFWQPVTGTVEEGESLLDCLRRELLEEIAIEKVEYVSDIIHQFHWSNEKKDCDEYVFSVKISNKEQIKISNEHEAFAWSDINKANYPMPENNKALNILKSLLLNGK